MPLGQKWSRTIQLSVLQTIFCLIKDIGFNESIYQKLATDFNSKTQGVRKKGLESHTTVRKPLHNIKDRQKRYKWCKQRLKWIVNDFRVIFIGEFNFEAFNRKLRVI
ncbi:hypothetical protein BpHYR1_043001, partial [Brachionus plicatilis]